ncbi:phage regulatory CII family protein [Endozoicomonas sp. ALC066]|uniref:phage regulatory CII family protein n=1 Tax=Endozoicomonas sp. ALC066 TaxID=3403078 RepID=UPI003BB6A7DD
MNPLNPKTGQPDTTLVEQAMKATVRNYKGGAQALGAHLNKSPGVLSNEINPSQPHHKLGLLDAILIMHITRDVQILKAMAACVNHSIINLGDFSATCDTELLNMYARWHAEIGDVSREVSAALSDGRITRDEFHRIRKEGMEQIHFFFEFLARVEALIDD